MPPGLSRRTANDRYTAFGAASSSAERSASFAVGRARGQGLRTRLDVDARVSLLAVKRWRIYRTSSISALRRAISPGPHLMTARARGET
jgi:hypothetical protein